MTERYDGENWDRSLVNEQVHQMDCESEAHYRAQLDKQFRAARRLYLADLLEDARTVVGDVSGSRTVAAAMVAMTNVEGG